VKTAYAIRRPVENSYLVRERDRRTLRELLVVVLVVLALGTGLLAYTWMHVEILRAGYRIDKLENRLGELLERERRLELEAAHREHPRHVERRAREELGMADPSLDQMLFYDMVFDDGVAR